MIKIKKNNPILIFLAVAALLFFLHLSSLLQPLENFLLSLAKPFSSRLYNIGTSFKSSYIANKDQVELQSKVERLTKEVAELTVANSRYREITEDNKKLSSTLKFLNANSSRLVVAEVIAKGGMESDSRDLVISRGRQDGLRSGLGLVSEEGVIIGKIVDVQDTTASACLLTSPNCRLAASIQNQNKTQGITNGDLGLTIKMDYIPQLEKIAMGDLVISSGLGGNIPRGLVIGKITQVRSESNEVWQSATIESLVNFDNLTIVSVIIP